MVKGIVFDIDGTILRGNRVLPGAAEALREVRRRGLGTVFLTNDSQETPRMWAERFGRLGIEVVPDEVITAAVVAAEVTADRFPTGKVLPVGDAALVEALRTRGLRVMDAAEPEQVDVVVMGMDSTFDQRRLSLLYRQISGGAQFIVTNDDRRRPAEHGYVPAAGAMVKAVAWATGVEPFVAGKPSASAALFALARLGLPAIHAVMVGDQPWTDIVMGKAVGMATVLASSDGKTRVDTTSLPLDQQPDVALSSLMGLLDWLDEGRP